MKAVDLSEIERYLDTIDDDGNPLETDYLMTNPLKASSVEQYSRNSLKKLAPIEI